MAKRVRLITGLILFTFLTCHLLNLSFGLASLAALDESRQWLLWFWSTGVGTVLLMASMIAHLTFGLLALYQRNTLRMNMSDTVQLALGLLIFPLLFGHLLGNVIGPIMTDVRNNYYSILTLFWVLEPGLGLKQVVVTVITWIHGCMGLVIWMRIQSWWPRVAGFIYPFVIAVPLLALLGMVEAGKEVIALSEDPEFMKAVFARLAPNDAFIETLLTMQSIGLWTYFTILGAVFAARYVRVRKDRAVLSVTYADGTQLDVSAGLTLLEISRMNNLPHASLCSGKGRCGSCRVRVLEGIDGLPAASDVEQWTLDRVHAEPDTRLACQVIPQSGAIKIERLLPPYISPKDLRRANAGELSAGELSSVDSEPIPETVT